MVIVVLKLINIPIIDLCGFASRQGFTISIVLCIIEEFVPVRDMCALHM